MPVVYRENVPPSTFYQSVNSLSSSLPIRIFQHDTTVFGTFSKYVSTMNPLAEVVNLE